MNPRGSMPASLSTRRPASSARTVCAPSRPTNSGDSPPPPRCGRDGRRRPQRDWRWRKPCCAIASPRRSRSSSQLATSGRRSDSGCMSRAGITSSVARATPRSSSQSRISAARSNVAGSTSCTATASTPPSRGIAHLAGPACPEHARGSRRPAARARAPTCAPRRCDARRRRAARTRAGRRRARAARSRARRAAARRAARRRRRSISSRGPPAATATTGEPARLRLEHDLAEGVGLAGEAERVRARVGARQLVALEPAEEASRARRAARRAAAARGRRRRAPGAAAGRRACAAMNASASRSMFFSSLMRPA